MGIADNYLAALCHCIDCQKVRHSIPLPPTFLPLYTSISISIFIANCHIVLAHTNQSLLQWTGGAFTSNAVVPRNSFKVTKGKPTLYHLPPFRISIINSPSNTILPFLFYRNPHHLRRCRSLRQDQQALLLPNLRF